MSSNIFYNLKGLSLNVRVLTPYIPYQNVVVERKNRHLLDAVRTWLIESSVPPKFWLEALTTTTFLINRLSSQVLDYESPYSPYFKLYSRHPSYTNLHFFGCICFMRLPPEERNKISTQSVRCAFLGYSGTQKGHLCYVLIPVGFMFQEMCYFFKINSSFLCLHHQSLFF